MSISSSWRRHSIISGGTTTLGRVAGIAGSITSQCWHRLGMGGSHIQASQGWSCLRDGTGSMGWAPGHWLLWGIPGFTELDWVLVLVVPVSVESSVMACQGGLGPVIGCLMQSNLDHSHVLRNSNYRVLLKGEITLTISTVLIENFTRLSSRQWSSSKISTFFKTGLYSRL